MKNIVQILSILFIMLSAESFAGTVYLEIEKGGRPAEDLLYNGEVLNSHQAIDLKRDGQDLSLLSPRESLLWEDKKQEILTLRTEMTEATFHSYLASTKGLFRSSLDVKDKQGNTQAKTLTVSLSNHGALLRSALLRKLGYKLQAPELTKKIKIHFSSIEIKNSFLDAMSDRSLTSRKRWVVENPKDESWVILQDVIIEQGRVSVHPLHWGVISDAALQNRRVFRSLIIPFVVGDFYENINLFNWSVGHKFNSAISFNYFLADSFHETTYNDAKWMARRIAKLNRSDWEEIIENTLLPYDVSRLLLEKLLSRRNALLHYFQLTDLAFDVDTQLNIGHVKNGKLTKKNYEGQALDFSSEDPDNPLRFSEMIRYFVIEGIGTGMQMAFNKINEYLQFANVGDAIMGHREDIYNAYMDHLKKYGSSVPFKLPVKAWADPIGGINITAGRSVVSGTYYGSDAPIQLVDNLGVRLNLGLFGGIDGTGQAMTSLLGGVSLSRNYMHLKPITEIKDGLKTSWKNLLVSKYMKGLGKVISKNYDCSVSKHAWTSEVIIDGQKYHKISFDRSSAQQKKEALDLRKKLLESGVSLSAIMMSPIDRSQLCDTEVEEKLDDDVKKLVKKMSTGEMIVIADGVSANLGIDATVPLSILLGSIKAGSITLSGGGTYSILKRTMIAKTEDGVQVYIQRLNSKSLQESIDFKYFISLLTLTKAQSFSKAKTKFFNMDWKNSNPDLKAKGLLALKSVLRSNNTEILENDLNPYLLDHKVKNKISRWKILLKKWDFLRQEHELNITPPESEQYVNTDFTRQLFLVQKVKRSGFRLFGFLSDVFRAITGGISLAQREGENPGNSLGGKAHWTTLSTEDELTSSYESHPVAVLEEVWNGWSTSRRKIVKIIKKAEKRYLQEKTARIDRNIFNDTKRVLLYEVKATFILYPEFLEELLKSFSVSKTAMFEKLVAIYGEKEFRDECEFSKWQEDTDDSWMDLSFLPRGHVLRNTCLPGWIDSVLRLKRKFKKLNDRKTRVRAINKILEKILKKMKPAELAAKLSPEDYFVVVKLNGFRKGDSVGNLDYLSDTVGTYDSDEGAGVFKTISSQIGISSYEIYARYFAEGF